MNTNNNENKKLQCEIIRDLLPLYHDGVVSDITKKAVKEHLDSCKECTSEYQTLCAEIPDIADETSSPKSDFKKFATRLKKRKNLRTLLTVLVCCALFLTIAYVCIMKPLVPVSNTAIDVIRTYKYESDGKNKVFIIYSAPFYATCSSMRPEFKDKKGGIYYLDFNQKNTIFSIEQGRDTDTYELILPNDCRDLYFNNELIWSEDNNHDNNIPEYVYAQDYYLRESLGYVDGFSMSAHGDVIFFKAWKEDGKKIVWDTDGNVVYEEFPDEEGIYPEEDYYKDYINEIF